MSAIRVGVIGCGQFMSRQHIQTINRSPEIDLEHLCTRNAEKAERMARKYGAARWTTRWEDVVADPAVDVVVVGVVPTLHAEIARAALEAGKPVYVEKPLAESTAECFAIQRCSEEHDVPVALGFNRRFAPAIRKVGEAIRSAGPPVSAVYRISDDDRVRPPEQRWKLACRLQIEVVHIFDLLHFLFESEPVTVFASESRFNDALVTLEFANGSQATILSSSWGSMAQPKEQMDVVLNRGAIEMCDFVELRAYSVEGLAPVSRFAGRAYDDCDNGHVSAFAEEGTAALLALRERYNRAFVDSGVLADSADRGAWDRVRKLLGDPPPPQINYAMDKGWGEALTGFCRAVAEGVPPRNANAADAVRATACATAARRSIQEGRPVPLDAAEWRL